MAEFEYTTAFSRNIGWLTNEEQRALSQKRVAVAGLGGVGGSHLLTLARLGIGSFVVADLDEFEFANFNRQAGAFVSTVGKPKTQTLVRMAQDINPNLNIRVFDGGVNAANVGSFLEGVDAYVDGLDYFAVDARRLVFKKCSELNIPAVTAAPLGMGAAVLNFLPGGMTFEDYFQLEGHEETDQLVRFLVGLSPRMLQKSYLVHQESVDFVKKKGPSTPMACDICAGMAAVQILKILLSRGRILCAPYGQQFDPYTQKYIKTWRPFGNKNPIQRIAIRIATRIITGS